MGKIRVNTIGDEKAEKEQKAKRERQKEAKKLAKNQELSVRQAQDESAKTEEKGEATGGAGGRAPADAEAYGSEGESSRASAGGKAATGPVAEKKSKKQQKKGPTKERSEKYKASAALIDKKKLYSLPEALELLEKTHLAKFDETVELHINILSTGVSGQVVLPHGTGKQTRVAILTPAKDAVAADKLLKEIETGKINFDVLIATPDAMPKLAKVARILGPRGLMPNPKSGTISTDPERLALSYAKGQMSFKTEAKAPIIHVAVGKLSFGKTKLAENIKVFLAVVAANNVKSVYVKSTMSPSVKITL